MITDSSEVSTLLDDALVLLARQCSPDQMTEEVMERNVRAALAAPVLRVGHQGA